MEAISLYLEKFRTIEPQERKIERAVDDFIKKEIKEISSGSIKVSVRGNRVVIHAPPALKSELFMRRQALSEYIKKIINAGIAGVS